MVRGLEETSTSQARCRKGPSWDQPSISSLVSSMSMEELKSLCQIPYNISLEVSDDQTISTIGEADYTIYFTPEQFTAILRFPVLLLVKQFLHVS